MPGCDGECRGDVLGFDVGGEECVEQDAGFVGVQPAGGDESAGEEVALGSGESVGAGECGAGRGAGGR